MNAAGRRTLALSLFVFLAALPDAMVPMALKSAVKDRWDLTLPEAHWFAGSALIGAVLAVFLLRPLERRLLPGAAIATASLVNALALACIAAPVSFEVAIAFRVVAGAMDMVTLSVLLGLLEMGAGERSGHRYGAASMAIMFGLAAGLAGGGVLVHLSLGSDIFLVGAALSVLLAVAAGCSGGLLNDEFMASVPHSVDQQPVRYWPTLLFNFTDRALSAVLVVTGTLFLVDQLELDARRVGVGLALVLLLMAIGSWPAGLLADRLGPLPVRIISVVGYAAAFAALAAAPWMGLGTILACLVVLGVSAAGLAPSMYVMAARKGRGTLDMGGVYTAGSAGYLCGVLVPGILLWLMRDSMPVTNAYQVIFLVFATLYLLINLPAIAAMAGWRMPGRRIFIET